MLILYTLLGALGGCVLGLVPALPVSVMMALLLSQPGWLTPEQAVFGGLGLLVGRALSSALLAVYQVTPEDGTLLVQQCARRYVQLGLGRQVSGWYGLGSLGGFILMLLMAPVAVWVLPTLHELIQPHWPWLVGSLGVLLVLGPQIQPGDSTGLPQLQWRWAAWRTGVGWLTFGLAGLLGLRLVYAHPLSNAPFSAVWPAVVGLFTLPTVLGQLVSPLPVPPQTLDKTLNITPAALGQGLFWGGLSGGVAAFFPGLSAGVGSWLVAQQLPPRQAPAFMVAQGCSQVFATVGAYLLLFMPGLQLNRSSLSTLVGAVYTTFTPEVFYWSLGAMALAGALAWGWFALVAPLYARVAPRLQPWMGWLTLGLSIGLVGGLLGWAGLAVLVVATAIGLLPVLWGAPRLSALGVFVLPFVLQALGWGERLAKLLGW